MVDQLVVVMPCRKRDLDLFLQGICISFLYVGALASFPKFKNMTIGLSGYSKLPSGTIMWVLGSLSCSLCCPVTVG